MYKRIDRKAIRAKKHYRIRKYIKGTSVCPRLAVYRSTKHIYAQIIDDVTGHTLVSASTVEADMRGIYGGNIEAAKKIGNLIGERAKAQNITKVVFDRGGLMYHGRVAAVAEGAREAGLEF